MGAIRGGGPTAAAPSRVRARAHASPPRATRALRPDTDVTRPRRRPRASLPFERRLRRAMPAGERQDEGEPRLAPGQLPRSRGSKTSRSASPSMLKAKTTAEMATPGQIAIQGATYM